MNASRALGLLRGLGTPAFSTSDAAARLGLSLAAASQTLRRLHAAGLARLVRRGLWTVHDPVEPFALVEYLTAPHPAYVSLQTALHLHGMIEQIPSVVYVVSLARSHRIRTALGTFSVHRVAPSFFGGFTVSPRSGAKVATPEKALLDVCYLAPGARAPSRLPPRRRAGMARKDPLSPPENAGDPPFRGPDRGARAAKLTASPPPPAGPAERCRRSVGAALGRPKRPREPDDSHAHVVAEPRQRAGLVADEGAVRVVGIPRPATRSSGQNSRGRRPGGPPGRPYPSGSPSPRGDRASLEATGFDGARGGGPPDGAMRRVFRDAL